MGMGTTTAREELHDTTSPPLPRAAAPPPLCHGSEREKPIKREIEGGHTIVGSPPPAMGIGRRSSIGCRPWGRGPCSCAPP
nr:unnamed protein product [Digitaria exilis]